MSELEDRLSAVLSDPGELARLTQMAQKLMGGGDAPAETPAPSGLPAAVGQLLGGGRKKPALLDAVGPYLDAGRRERLSRALRMASMARMAGAALQRMGEENGL